MNVNTEVLIVGGGPIGLMMACQLLRFGVSFRIIDKENDRSQESRAFGIQAKSMEIFQNIGVVEEFLKESNIVSEGMMFFDGKLKVHFDFKNVKMSGAPYFNIYLLPQSITEEILIKHLEKFEKRVERQTELVSFIQKNNEIEALIKNHKTQKSETISCKYLIGCDGAKSTVRDILNLPFEGGSYEQDFLLIDSEVDWKFPKDKLILQMTKKGILVFVPLQKDYVRLVMAEIKTNTSKDEPTPSAATAHKVEVKGVARPSRPGPGRDALVTLPQLYEQLPSAAEIEIIAKNILGIEIKISKPIWISRFHLHHRAVKQYQKGNAFLAGDAAHIHSPVGAQGMNTGLQDASNLGWKIAMVLKKSAPSKLLDTYQMERLDIGKKLLKTTDRFFGFVISKNFFIRTLRPYLIPLFMKMLANFPKIQRLFVCFVSELNIYYHLNDFISENIGNADPLFLKGPSAGHRAPDAQSDQNSLFEIFRKKPFNILIFQSETSKFSETELLKLKKIDSDYIAIHQFQKNKENQDLFNTYGITQSGIYLIRPDGYVGFRSFGNNLSELLKYLGNLFNKQL